MNIGKNTTLCDCDVPEESRVSDAIVDVLVQLFVVSDGELEMAGDDTG
jgi:hypothetical protein